MDVPYRSGGLMRCCTLTLAMAYELSPLQHVEGNRLPCRACSTTMVFRDGAWEWDRSAKNKYGNVPVPPDAELM